MIRGKMIRGTTMLMLGAAILLSGAGCTSTLMADTQTIHNREATRIWIVRRTSGATTSHDEVVFCDASGGGTLCQAWGR